jgi:FkbM family methyltransferase
VKAEPNPVRPPSTLRRLGKVAYFLCQGLRPGTAAWLARHDAPVARDFAAIPLPAIVAAFTADPSWADIEAGEGTIRSRALNLTFEGDDLVLHGYATWLALTRLGWNFVRSGEPGCLRASHGSFVLNVTTTEECEMVREIHLEPCCYDLRLPGVWDVVDVGANVGMAALFFAQQPWCRSVTSFEPFAPTAEAFEANMALNPALATKITLVRKALGESDRTLDVDYNPALRGSMSLTGVGSWRDDRTVPRQKVSIQVERASTVLAPVLAARRGRPVLGKIDCEGSEYTIFRDLEASGMLAHFSAFVIEWHGHGPGEIIETLHRQGFATHVSPLSADHHTLGLIYAIRLAPS